MTHVLGSGAPLVARVVPLVRVHHLEERVFDYLVPEALMGRVERGTVVGVRFGSRQVRGVVLGLTTRQSDEGIDLRPLESVEDRGVCEELMSLAERLAERYVAPFGSCLRLVAPPTSSAGSSDPRSRPLTWVLPVQESDSLADEPVGVEPGIAERYARVRGSLTAKQTALLAAVPSSGIAVAEACRRAGVGKGVLRALVEKDLIRLGPAVEGAGSEGHGSTVDQTDLSNEQKRALETLIADYERTGSAQRQVWGITGSGKTEIYLNLVARALLDQAGVIVLVPEIALVAMMVDRFRQRFGDRVGVVHSGLSGSQRRREYLRIADGQVKVVIGARSAVFAPVVDLRLVIIDESHDVSYKQEEAPGYHSRTVAELRLAERDSLLVEGSASPAVESMLSSGECIRLRTRARGSLSECEAIDMRQQGGDGVLAAFAREALAETVRRGEQAIILLNRRGHSGYVHCQSCGHVMMCEDCELSLTYHNSVRRLLCHHCGRSYVHPPICPECRSSPLVKGGAGTERLAEQLERSIGKEHVFRLDSDATTSGTRVARILSDFSQAHPGVLVGTQMVAKGHDYPDVTLVVVADADTGLYIPDFRASERTFQLLVQVSGRTGRAESPGRVLVQTWNPDVPCIRMALERDDEGFYARELDIRERLGYPPFTQLIRLTTVGDGTQRVRLAAYHLAERLSPHFDARGVRGPARLPSLRGRSRWHVVVASEDGERARKIVTQAITQLRDPYRRRGVLLSVDVDPFSFA